MNQTEATKAAYFKKGDPRINKNGRPRGRRIPDIIRKFADVPAPARVLQGFQTDFPKLRSLKRLTLYEALVLRAFIDAGDGDAQARQWLVERAEGKVPDRVSVENPDGSKLDGVPVEAILAALTPPRPRSDVNGPAD